MDGLQEQLKEGSIVPGISRLVPGEWDFRRLSYVHDPLSSKVDWNGVHP